MIMYYGQERIEKNHFDVTMGHQTAQITDLVGLYILKETNKNILGFTGGLYRDDALFLVNSND